MVHHQQSLTLWGMLPKRLSDTTIPFGLWYNAFALSARAPTSGFPVTRLNLFVPLAAKSISLDKSGLRFNGFRVFETLQTALFHALGRLPEPKFTHRFW